MTGMSNKPHLTRDKNFMLEKMLPIMVSRNLINN
jgi:hypothetical protein